MIAVTRIRSFINTHSPRSAVCILPWWPVSLNRSVHFKDGRDEMGNADQGEIARNIQILAANKVNELHNSQLSARVSGSTSSSITSRTSVFNMLYPIASSWKVESSECGSDRI